MIILSINFGHDASLSLFENENIIDFLEIERISRLKHHVGITSNLIKSFLKQNNMEFKSVSSICVTGTQNWPLCHTSDLIIKNDWTQEHNVLFNENLNNLIKKNNNFVKSSETLDSMNSKVLKKQFIKTATPSLNRLEWNSPYLDGVNIFQENINELFNSLENKKYKYICPDFYIPISLSFEGIVKCGFYINHHAAHAFHAAKYSKKSSIIVTHDGGLNILPFNSGGIYYYDYQKGLFPINSHNFAFGQIYDYVSQYFNITPGKLMGLASFGNANPYIQNIENIAFDIFNAPVNVRTNKVKELTNSILEISKKSQSINTNNLTEFNFEFEDRDFAIQAAVNTQTLVQSLFCKQISRVVSLIQNIKPDTKDLMLTGGFTLNCPTNSQLEVMLPSFNIKPLPACGDTGISIGGAVALNYLSKNKSLSDENLDFNNAAFPISKLNKINHIQNKDFVLRPIDKNNLINLVSKLLSENKIICINRGRSEVGPRALGNRSIIALASSSKTRDLINTAKGREDWRPLAPICCDIDFHDYFEGSVSNSRFMLFTNKVKTNLTNAIKHVDNTARVQCLYDKTDWLYQTLQVLKSKGLTPVIVNTSFNCAGEPIVEDLEQSLNSFEKMGFDCLIYNNDTIIFSQKSEEEFQNKVEIEVKEKSRVFIN